jgi:hypothetical protein
MMSRAPAKAVSRRPRGTPRLEAIRISTTNRTCSGTGAGVRHLPRLPALLQPVQFVPDAVRRHRRIRDRELDGVARQVYWEVVDHCYLCDMCYMTKCPYVPPHEWNVDFPAPDAARQGGQVQTGRGRRDKLLTSTDAGRPARRHPGGGAGGQRRNRQPPAQAAGQGAGRASRRAPVPNITARPAQAPATEPPESERAGRPGRAHARQGGAVRHLLRQLQRTAGRRGPGRGVRAQRHPGAPGRKGACCGMPKLELGDLDAVAGPRRPTSRCWRADRRRAGTSSRRCRPAC